MTAPADTPVWCGAATAEVGDCNDCDRVHVRLTTRAGRFDLVLGPAEARRFAAALAARADDVAPRAAS